MHIRNLLISAVIATAAMSAHGQVANYALSLAEGGSVDCGPMTEINGAASYTLQLWLCPDAWTVDAAIVSRGNAFKLALGESEGKAVMTVGGKQLQIASSALAVGQWSQITVICDNGEAKALVNGEEAGAGMLPAISATNDILVIGGKYAGRVDELRIWKSALASQYNYFINNTLNIHAPQWDDLAAYYKMDQSDCANLVDYKGIETPEAERNNHGIFSAEGVQRTLVTDNAGLPYLVNGAYTANERFYDRGIERDQYLLSNDLIILGVESLPSGHVRVVTPNNHAAATGGVAYMDECDGRTGVASFDGTGKLTAPARTFSPTISSGVTNGYTFETWMYIDEWVKDAYLFRKETADSKQGFSVRLGEQGQIFVRCNGEEYGANLNVTEKEWHHIGIVPRNGDTPRQTYLFVYDGIGKSATTSLCSGGTDCTPTGIDELEATLGEGYKGKLDDTMIWDMSFDAAAVKQHSQAVPMPGFGIVLISSQMQKANACYLYDKAEDLGFSSYSQDNWRDIMMSAYEGYAGARVRISVKSHEGWQTTIANAERRKLFAADLGEIAKGYDGVELDLEWMDGTQTNLGLLAQEIRAALPEGKTLFISCHAYGAYRFPLGDMPVVDGFTFQQYGPQPTFFSWDSYVNSVKAFKNYGFENEKIMTSYATTTSRGINGSQQREIAGVKDGFFTAEGFEPTDNSAVKDGYTYSFTGPDQTYRRAAYCVENGLQGIFYWDMGNDLPVASPYNLAKWCSYGLNANVDRYVDKVEVKHGESGVQSVTADNKGEKLTVKIARGGDTAYVSGVEGAMTASVYSIAGAQMSAQPINDGAFAVSELSKGIYVVKVTTGNGASYATRIIKQ